MKYAEVQNCIGGAFVSPDAPLLDVHDPSSGRLISRVPLSSRREVDAAVIAARAAFPAWSGTPIKERVQVLYRYKALLEKHIDELFQEAGLPAGVLQVVHGGREAVEAICDHPGIAAVSFVGSTKVAQIVYRRATSNLKRCLALGGAKNHLIVMPDADREMAAANIVASMSGCAGQRCMAASVMVAVSATDHIIARRAEHARAMGPGREVGPVISAAARERIIRYIDEAEAAGATVVVAGRAASGRGRRKGY